jgi:D-alanine-D-alanine ligase
MVEEYVGGREFNISLFGFPVPRVLPVAEIDFSAFPEEFYRIVGYRAKWDPSSFEYKNTPRRFSPPLSPGMSAELRSAALACFHIFRLRDYGRVDMRVDARNRVFVLEVNANPCLSPDAGLAASYMHEGRHHAQMVDELCNFIERRMHNDADKALRGRRQGANSGYSREAGRVQFP